MRTRLLIGGAALASVLAFGAGVAVAQQGPGDQSRGGGMHGETMHGQMQGDMGQMHGQMQGQMQGDMGRMHGQMDDEMRAECDAMHARMHAGS